MASNSVNFITGSLYFTITLQESKRNCLTHFSVYQDHVVNIINLYMYFIQITSEESLNCTCRSSTLSHVSSYSRTSMTSLSHDTRIFVYISTHCTAEICTMCDPLVAGTKIFNTRDSEY
jgi:hypothetical protein